MTFGKTYVRVTFGKTFVRVTFGKTVVRVTSGLKLLDGEATAAKKVENVIILARQMSRTHDNEYFTVFCQEGR